MSSCKSCATEGVFHAFSNGDDSITLKLVRNNSGYGFMELVVLDGDWEFQSACIPLGEFDEFVRKILKVRRFVKDTIKNGEKI